MEELIGNATRTHNPVSFHENEWLDNVEEWLKFELRQMLNIAMAQENHYYIYGIWCGPPDPVKYPWTIDGPLGEQLMGEWVARGNGPQGIMLSSKSI